MSNFRIKCFFDFISVFEFDIFVEIMYGLIGSIGKVFFVKLC